MGVSGCVLGCFRRFLTEVFFSRYVFKDNRRFLIYIGVLGIEVGFINMLVDYSFKPYKQ
jgi:hypothetical protein